MLLSTLCILFCGAASTVAATSLSLNFAKDASYSLTFDGDLWALSDATSGGIGVRSDGASLTAGVGGGLALDSAPLPISGASPLGPFTGTELSFGGGLVIARAKHVALPSGAAAILCELTFPRGLNGSSGGNLANDLAAGWPVFAPPTEAAPARGFLTWTGGMLPPRVGQWNATPGTLYGIQGGPVIVFNASRATVVTSAASNFMVGGTCGGAARPLWAGEGAFGAGLFASLSSVPVGTVHTTLLVAGMGVRATMRAWGDALLVLGGKARTTLGRDLGTSHVSYWTDNGAYYFYQPEVGKNFEQTILDVLAAADATHVPYATVQLDSWWYLQDHNVSASIPAPLLLWEPRADVFPSGMTPWVGRPLVLHNRMFSPHSAYHAMGYEFINEPGAWLALPVDKRMFTYIMGKAVAWGMTMYEQDWLSYTFNELNTTQSNFTAAATWLDALGGAASDLNITVQFCMALASMVLHSTTLPAVTNARASGDYHPSSFLPPAYTENWQVGLTSLLLDSLGLQPSKDNMWSSEVQPGSHFDPNTEPNTHIHAISAVLSTGPVGFSDGLGFADPVLIARTCRSDGLLLRPDAPAAHLDAALVATMGVGGTAAVPYVVAAPVTLGGFTWTLILAAELGAPFTLGLQEDLAPQPNGATGGVVVVDWYQSGSNSSFTVVPAGGSITLTPGQGCTAPACGPTAVAFRYLLVAPILSDGWAYLGEPAKFVPVSQFRTPTFAAAPSGGGFTATLSGAPGEGTVAVAARAPNGERVVAECDVASGAAHLTCGGALGNACTCEAST